MFYRRAQKLIKSFAGGKLHAVLNMNKNRFPLVICYLHCIRMKKDNCPKKATRRRNSQEFVFFVTIFGHKEFHSPQRYRGYVKDLRQSNILKRVHLWGILGIPTKITEGNTSF